MMQRWPQSPGAGPLRCERYAAVEDVGKCEMASSQWLQERPPPPPRMASLLSILRHSCTTHGPPTFGHPACRAAECHAYSAPDNATLEEWLDAYPDNWMTRELVRTACKDAASHSACHACLGLPAVPYCPPAQLTQVGRSVLYDRRPLAAADLRAAQARLHLFAAVLVLERPQASMALLRARFGWQETGWAEHRAGSAADSDAAAELPPELLARLRQRNQLDEQLYDYAVALHEAQAARWLAGGGGGGSVKSA